MIIDSLLYEIGLDTKGVQEGLAKLQTGAQQVDNEFNGMASRWGGVIQGLISNVIAPVAGAFAVGKVINSYMNDVSEVATLTGAYNQKLDEWRIKRAQLARVTKEDIALYKQYKEAMTGFNIAIADVSAKLVRTFSPVMKIAVEGLQQFTKWINRNQDNIVRFLLVTAGVLTGVFLPAILKTSAALLMSPLTWLIGALGVLVIIFDDLTTYLRGGKSALAGFWSYFGTGPEIMAKLNSAFESFKQIISVIWKPLALIAAGFAAFKIGAVLVKGFISVLTSLKAIMSSLAAHPLLIALTALIGLIVWISDAFKRAGGEWSKVMGLMAQDLIDFLNLFGGLGDYLADALSEFKGFFSALGSLVESIISTVYNLGQLVWAFLSGAPDEIKDKLIEALSGAFTSAAQALNDFLSSLLGALYTLLQYAGKAIASLGELLLKGLNAAVAGIITLLGRLIALIGGLATSMIKALGNIIASMAASIFNAVMGVFQGLFKLIVDTFAPIPKFFGSLFEAVISSLSNFGTSLLDALSLADKYIKGAFIALYQSINQILTTIAKTISNAFSSAFDFVRVLLSSLGSFFLEVSNTISTAFSNTWQALEKAAFNFFNGIKELVSNSIKSVLSTLSVLVDALTLVLTSAIAYFNDTWTNIKAYCSKITSDIDALWKNITAFISELFANALATVIEVFARIKDFLGSIASNIAQKFENAVNSIISVFGAAYDGIAKTFAKIKDTLSSVVISLLDLGVQVSQIFSSVVDTITSAFDAGLNAAIEFFNSIFDFFSQIPARIVQAFDISGLIDGAKEKLKGIAGEAMGSVKSFFGFGSDEKEQEKNIKATKQAVTTAIKDINTGMANNSQLIANNPTVANTSSITNSTYNTDNSRRSDNKQNVNNTININVPNGTDARGIVREAQKSFNNLNASNNMVMASEYGNYNN